MLADMGARLATFTANPFSILFPESVANSFCVSIMIEIFCCCWIYYINRKQTWLKTTRPTRLDEILPVLLFPNEFKDILFPLMVSMPSDSSRIFCRALSVASKEFVYTTFGINKLSAVSEKADLTASYAEEKGDINERRRPREDLVTNIYYYIICPNEERKTYRNEGR